MPELPEVETVRRGLEPVMQNAVITQTDVNRPDLRWPFPERMAERLRGVQVLGLRRRSKCLLLDLSSGETLLIHLGMSGRLTIQAPGSSVRPGVFVQPIKPKEKHDHVVFHLNSGIRVVFNDPRRFGAMDIFKTDAEQTHRLLANLGPEPLGNGFHADHLAKMLRGKSSPVKSALLDQSVVAGLGNIYVCEALWHAGISPKRRSNRISLARVERLVPAIQSVLNAAIDAGGSSLRDHRQADGELGYFQHQFCAYGRAEEPCSKDGCTGRIRRITQTGRSSFYCPVCQR